MNCYWFLKRSFFVFIHVITDIHHSHWAELRYHKEDDLAELARNIPTLIDASKSNSPLRKYTTYFSEFRTWCLKHKSSSLPATPATVSLFISHLVQCKFSSSVIRSVFYAVQWYHDKNLFNNLCADKLVKYTFEGALRTFGKT
jgi:hypothetical protein